MRWKIELPNNISQFYFETISDDVLHIRYTAREAGHLAADAVSYIKEEILAEDDNLLQLCSLKSDFPAEWHLFGTVANESVKKLEINIDSNRFLYCTKSLG